MLRLARSANESVPDNFLDTLGPGQPLDAASRAFFEPRFNYDFSRVRVHTDAQDAASARTVNARAFTVGRDIVFGEGHYGPGTDSGRRLLAHELTHVIQQDARGVALFRDDEPDPPTRPTLKSVKFADLKDRAIVSDPTGRKHGIQVERRGDDLYYHMPGGDVRLVPRPKKDSKVGRIEKIYWGPDQDAFSVDYDQSGLEPFAVNVFGSGRYQNFADAAFRKPAALDVLPGGLEVERKPGVLASGRPTRLKNAVRYHMPGASYSLYVGTDRSAEVADDASGKSLLKYTGLVDLRVMPDGAVEITWKDPTGVVTVQFSLRGPVPAARGLGALVEPAGRTRLLADLRGLGITIEEVGARFSEHELQAAWDLLSGWKGAKSVVESLKALKVPGLTLRKDVLISGASYSPNEGRVKIPGDVVLSHEQQRMAMTHELAHTLFHAAGLDVPSKGKPPQHVIDEAKELWELSDLDLIKEGSIGSRKKMKTAKEWEPVLSTDKEINEIWRELHYRFKIGDPEGTGDIRGFDVADESRYSGDPRGDPVGHGFENVTEFIASFVTSVRRYEAKMVATVRASGSAPLADLYRRLWARVNSTLVTLGTVNPFAATGKAPARKP